MDNYYLTFLVNILILCLVRGACQAGQISPRLDLWNRTCFNELISVTPAPTFRYLGPVHWSSPLLGPDQITPIRKMSEGDFDDFVDELGGFGKYQKKFLYLLLCKFWLCIILSLAIGPRSSVPDNALPDAPSSVRPPRPQLRVPPPRGDLCQHAGDQPNSVEGKTEARPSL